MLAVVSLSVWNPLTDGLRRTSRGAFPLKAGICSTWPSQLKWASFPDGQITTD